MKNDTYKLPGFTLTELLIVLAIIGILVLLALPNLMPLISRAKSTEAQLQLQHVHALEKNYFYTNSKFSNDLEALGYEQVRLATEGGTANFKIEVTSASSSSFLARAIAVSDFDGDGTFNIWEVDQEMNLREVVKD